MKSLMLIASILLTSSAFAGKPIPAPELQDQPWWYEENQQQTQPQDPYRGCDPLEVTENKNGECMPPEYEEDNREQQETDYRWEEVQSDDLYITEKK